MKLYIITWCFTTVIVWIMLGAFQAFAHDAPLGWAYGQDCCSGVDCRQVADSDVSEQPDGYHIKATGEVLGYSDKKLRDSHDQFFHWCSVNGKPDSATVCLYRPARGF